MIIYGEFSFRIVEGLGFKQFCHVMQPRFVSPRKSLSQWIT